jgi:hypothetical protein
MPQWWAVSDYTLLGLTKYLCSKPEIFVSRNFYVFGEPAPINIAREQSDHRRAHLVAATSYAAAVATGSILRVATLRLEHSFDPPRHTLHQIVEHSLGYIAPLLLYVPKELV